MDKPFKNLDEQIKILIERKIFIEDIEYAKDYLLRNNYYNVINWYGKFFLIEDEAKEGTTFNEIVAAHLFDEDLKSAYFRYIIIVENCFKSVLAYTFSRDNQYEKDFYLNPKNYNGDKDEIDALIKQLNKVIDKYKKIPNHPISHYLKKYNHLPLWVLINYLMFGQSLKMFSLLNIKTKNSIAKHLNQIANKNIEPDTPIRITYDNYYQILSNLLSLRNSSAHDNTLLRFTTSFSYPYIPCLHNHLKDASKLSKNDLYQTHIIMKLFLTTGQYENLNRLVNLAFMNLDKKVYAINTEEITSTTGFPCDWIDKKKNKSSILSRLKQFIFHS